MLMKYLLYFEIQHFHLVVSMVKLNELGLF